MFGNRYCKYDFEKHTAIGFEISVAQTSKNTASMSCKSKKYIKTVRQSQCKPE